MTKAERLKWRRAARLWGLQLEYTNFQGENVKSSYQTLRAALELVARQPAKVTTLDSLIARGRERKIFRMIEPCYLQAKAGWISVSVFFPERRVPDQLLCGVRLESGKFLEVFPKWEVRAKRYVTSQGVYLRAVITIRQELPAGYHRFELLKGGRTVASSVLLCAPPVSRAHKKSWGIFAPLYSLHSKRSWGAGDLADLRYLQRKTKEWGGQFTGILPLLASPHQEGDLYSPYAPTSKLFWDEFYLDVGALLAERDFAKIGTELEQKQLDELNSASLVPYAEIFKIKKNLLGKMAKVFFARGSSAFDLFVKEKPLVLEYAVFRSQGDPQETNYHLFVQFQMHRQLCRLKDEVNEGKIAGLYMDFPLGVRPDGFDGQYFADLFLKECSVGAPPDLLFKDGQNWGFNPILGESLRSRYYDYFIHCLRHQMQFASVLRIDHVMGLQRVYIIPPGLRADEGIYLRHNAEELFAIIAIEAQRHAVRVVGENLGTVSASIESLLRRHGFLGMWVHIFAAGEQPLLAMDKIDPFNLACLNTHDLIPFQGFLDGADLETFYKLGFLNEEQFFEERNARQKMVHAWTQELHDRRPQALLYRYLAALAQSKAQLLLINVEDLWQETLAQNIPGTLNQHPNWQRKLKYPLEKWTEQPEVESFFKWISGLRHKRKSYGKPSDLRRPVSL